MTTRLYKHSEIINGIQMCRICIQKTTDSGGAFFENVFLPKGAQKNSQIWGVWGVGFGGSALGV